MVIGIGDHVHALDRVHQIMTAISTEIVPRAMIDTVATKVRTVGLIRTRGLIALIVLIDATNIVDLAMLKSRQRMKRILLKW